MTTLNRTIAFLSVTCVATLALCRDSHAQGVDLDDQKLSVLSTYAEQGSCTQIVGPEVRRSLQYDNDLKEVRTYFSRRQANIKGQCDLKYAQQIGRLAAKRAMGDALDQYKAWQADRPTSGASEKSRPRIDITGGISWPMALKSAQFEKLRDEIEMLASSYEIGEPEVTERKIALRAAGEGIKAELKKRIKELRPAEYSFSKRFVDDVVSAATAEPQRQALAGK